MKATPPLLQLIEGRRVRPRQAPVNCPREIVLHMDVAHVLRRHIMPGWQWCHYPAGERRDVRTASKLKAMGTKAGWPDLILLSPAGLFHALELKRDGEHLSDEQQAFQTWCIGQGVPHAVASSKSDALAILASWRCIRVAAKTGGAG